MTAYTSFPDLAPPQASHGAAALDRCRADTEGTFAGAGNNLADALDELRGIEGQFDALRRSFGADVGTRLHDSTATTIAAFGGLRTALDGIVADSDLLASTMRRLAADVGELDRVVRTIANVAINARIQGNQLVPPRPQVSAFLARLDEMATAAEEALARVKDSTGTVANGIDALSASGLEVHGRIDRQLLPALLDIAQDGQRMLDRQDEMSRVTADLGADTAAISRDVGRLITGLQIGDSTRQRLERAQEVLDPRTTDAGIAESRAQRAHLAAALLRGAATDAAPELRSGLSALQDFATRTVAAIDRARRFYLSPDNDAAARADCLTSLLPGLLVSLSGMRDRAAGLAGGFETILHLEKVLTGIAHQMRLSGLNAVLICAKLGEDGRPLRELAQWLRVLTDESDAIVARLQARLTEARRLTDCVGQTRVEQIDRDLSVISAAAGSLVTLVADGRATLSEAARAFDRAGRSIPARLGEAQALLVGYLDRLPAIERVADGLDLQARQHPDVADPAARDLASDCLARLRGCYTMAAERRIHDAFCSDAAPSKGAAAPEAAPAQVEPAEQDLDDILF